MLGRNLFKEANYVKWQEREVKNGCSQVLSDLEPLGVGVKAEAIKALLQLALRKV